jgi:hypothetical protein
MISLELPGKRLFVISARPVNFWCAKNFSWLADPLFKPHNKGTKACFEVLYEDTRDHDQVIS